MTDNKQFEGSGLAQTRPDHHVHGTSDPLPENRDVDTIDYSPNAIGRMSSSNWQEDNDLSGAQGRRGHDAFTEQRPLAVRPTAEGGVAVEGRSDLPEGQANTADKFIGKAQKVAGKYTHKSDLHEKGELRETGGKAASQGQARAAHD